jgi:uncharacterized protein YjgD (DUF1641 family)
MRRLFEGAQDLEWALQNLESLRDLIKDAGPITTDAIHTLTETLDRLDQKGVFSTLRELVRSAEGSIASLTEEDLQHLREHSSDLAAAARAVSQPSVLRLVRRLSEAYEQAMATTETLNVSLLGLLWRARHRDVRRGVALLLRLVEALPHEPKT